MFNTVQWRKISIWLFPSAIVLSTFLSFLGFHNYPLLTMETIIVLGVALTLGLAFSVLALAGGCKLEVCISAILLTGFIDIQFDWRLRFVLLFGLGALVLGWVLRHHLSQILGATFVPIFVVSIVYPSKIVPMERIQVQNFTKNNPSLPPILHIVLDEHIGIEGIPDAYRIPNGVKDQLKQFYQEFGFKIYGNAYTRYAETLHSLPNIFNFSRTVTDRKIAAQDREMYFLDENKYFRQLADRGYVFRIYQSQYFSFCRSHGIPVQHCETYNYTGLTKLDKITSRPEWKSIIIISRYLNRSKIYRLLRSLYQNMARRKIFGLPIIENNNFAPLASMSMFDLLAEDLRNAKRGVIYFAHLLIPHRPFMFDESCNIVLDHPYDNLVRNSELWLKEYQLAYYQQVLCTKLKIKNLLEVYANHKLFDEGTIVIHGDHGSRISSLPANAENAKDFTKRSILEYFSTLFAVKKPSLKPRYSVKIVPVEDLLQQHVLSKRKNIDQNHPNYHYVFLRYKKKQNKFKKKSFELKP